jgi:hypothetical protein
MTRSSDQAEGASLLRAVALTQAAYFGLTGLWPLLSMRTFQAVTGPKSVGVLVVAVGGALGVAGLQRRTGPEVPALAIASAVGLAGIDVVYATKGRISRIYLLDAVAEAAFVAAWVVALRRSGERRQ